MSYILEALKKAQAERALGSAPTLHAMPLHPVASPVRRSGNASLWVGLLVGLLVAGAALMVWRSSDSEPKPQAVQAPATAAAPVVRLAPMPAIPAVPPAPARPMPEAPRQAVPDAAAAAARPAPVTAPQPSPAPAAPAPTPATAQAVSAAAAPEENLPTLRELPEAVARDVPQVAVGGYIYSRNPADRLLLVDKVLRHEGEELAPGLVLEKLLPKAAIMNYKGYRYKVAY